LQVTAALRAARASLRRTIDVLTVLAISDLRVRYGRGGLRAMKWFLDPFAALGIYLVLITVVLDRGGGAPGLVLVCAILPFQLVVMTVSNAMQSIQTRASIIVDMAFPRMLVPLSALVTEGIAFTASLVMVPVMMAIYGIPPTAAILWLPLALALTAALSAALAYPSALIGVWWPELQPFALSLLRALFFLAPGLLALSELSGIAREWLPLNPLTGLFEFYRHALVYGDSPPAWEILYPLAVTVVVFGFGLALFRREQPFLAKLVG
jgi:ABC-type polysaccharide/polyol phosphate export permease